MPVAEVVGRADDADLLVRNRLADDRRCRLELLDRERDVLLDGVAQRVAGPIEHCLDGRREGLDQRRQMPRQRGAVLDRFDRGIDRAAARVTEHHEKRRMQDRDRVLEAGNDVGIGDVAGDAAHEQVAAAGVECEFGRNPRVGAAEDAGKRVLAPRQRFPFVLEVMAFGHAVDITGIAFHQPLERGIRGDRVFGFRRGFRVFRKTAYGRRRRERGRPGERHDAPARERVFITRDQAIALEAHNSSQSAR